MAKPEPCHGGCDHTDAEHRAFDRGVKDAQAGKKAESNPYKLKNLTEAWATGHSVGVLDSKDEWEEMNKAE